MFQPSVITLDPSAYAANLAFVREHLNGARFCSVVKGNAYGHGLRPFVQMAMNEGVGYFAVYSADEAYELLKDLEDKPDVFIMGMAEGDALEWAVEQQVECAVFDFQRLDALIQIARRLKAKARIHVEVETGMNRTGFDPKDCPRLIEVLRSAAANVELMGLFTHFAGAESMSNDARVKKQIDRFAAVRRSFVQAGLSPRIVHQACSAGMMNFPGTIGDMARIGIMQYGYWSNVETWSRYAASSGTMKDPLRRVISWRSRVMALTDVKRGSSIGYGSTAQAQRNMKVAVVPVGYSHGFARGLSNVGKVLVGGRLATVVGIVNMNAISIDITDAEHVGKGDEVTLIGAQGDTSISVASFSEMSEVLNYEMLTRLPRDIPRVIIDSAA